MQKIPRGIVAIAVVLVLTGGVFYYQFAQKVSFVSTSRELLPPSRSESTIVQDTQREVSTLTTYEVPEADITHHVKFTAVVDREGRVLEIRMVEMPQGEASEKQKEFAGNLTVMIQGKKLSELTQVDKVGKSTLTTNAFNTALSDLRSQM